MYKIYSIETGSGMIANTCKMLDIYMLNICMLYIYMLYIYMLYIYMLYIYILSSSSSSSSPISLASIIKYPPCKQNLIYIIMPLGVNTSCYFPITFLSLSNFSHLLSTILSDVTK